MAKYQQVQNLGDRYVLFFLVFCISEIFLSKWFFFNLYKHNIKIALKTDRTVRRY